jgi:predicted dehydrogenase
MGNTVCKIRDEFLADLRKVVVEKPFTVSTEEADRVIAAGKKSGKILTVFQSKILHPILL